MSYLNWPRAHFAGVFLAAPSTVNNDVRNFDIDHPDPGNGSWNPDGNAAFDLQQCSIVSAVYGDGTAAQAGGDVILSSTVARAARPTAKIVDLDPQQQLVSMIFGLKVSIARPGSAPWVVGDFMPAAFADLWFRAGQRGDGAMGVFYQSQLNSVRWGDVSSSRFLQELKAAATDGLLSIKFNLDGYSTRPGPNFTKGRVTGTIGAATRAEPRHFVTGRHLGPGTNGDALHFCVAQLNEPAGKVHLDLGNALPTDLTAGGAPNFLLADVGALSLASLGAQGSVQTVDAINYRGDFYMKSAGILDLPVGRSLTATEVARLRDGPLAIVRESGGAAGVVLAEPADGKHLRADQFVARLNPGDTFAVDLHATRFGKPLPNATVSLAYRPSNERPPVNLPARALPMPAPVKTDDAGVARVGLKAANPATPRQIIDGAVFFVDYAIDGAATPNDSNFLSVLVWDDFVGENPPTWHGSMKGIFTLYANLYPFMARFFDMSNYDSVSENADEIAATLSLPITDPHYMPVTRDLSDAKKESMIRWLTSPGRDGRPLLGTPAAPALAPAAGAVAGAAAGAAAAEADSKTRALTRTMNARNRS